MTALGQRFHPENLSHGAEGETLLARFNLQSFPNVPVSPDGSDFGFHGRLHVVGCLQGWDNNTRSKSGLQPRNGLMGQDYSKLLDSIREKTGDKDYEIAANVGVSPQAVSDWRNGKSRGIRPGPRKLLAQVYGVSDRYLRTGDGPVFTDGKGAAPSLAQQSDGEPFTDAVGVLLREWSRAQQEIGFWKALAGIAPPGIDPESVEQIRRAYQRAEGPSEEGQKRSAASPG